MTDLLLTDTEMLCAYYETNPKHGEFQNVNGEITKGLRRVRKAQLAKCQSHYEAEIKQAVKNERAKLAGELEDIRCSASGEYLRGIELLIEQLKG